MVGRFHSDGNTLTDNSFLNRVIRWDPASGGAEMEADTRHVAMVLRDLGKSSPVVTLVVKLPKSEELLLLAGAKPLNAQDTTLCRSVTMRVNYLSLDRLDLSFAGGSLARWMKSLEVFKRVGALLARCDQLERSCLNRRHWLEPWRCAAKQTMLET